MKKRISQSLTYRPLTLLVFLGTILSSFAVLLGCKTEYGEKWKTAFFLNLLAGTLQFLTAIIVVGWVWSVMTGKRIYISEPTTLNQSL